MNIRYISILLFTVACHQTPKPPQTAGHSCTPTQSRFSSAVSTTTQESKEVSNEGMVLIPGGAFSMGGDDDQAWRDEYPKHEVVIDSFWMDVHEVTSAQFADFVEATGYVTTAEKAVDWEEIKKELPPGTPKVNVIFGSIPILSKEISNIKKGEPIPVNQFSDCVTSAGFKPATF